MAKRELTTDSLQKLESMCICRICPTYLKVGEDDYVGYCLPNRGKSRKIKDEAGCICPGCPVVPELNLTKLYFCTRGTEEQQQNAEP